MGALVSFPLEKSLRRISRAHGLCFGVRTVSPYERRVITRPGSIGDAFVVAN